MAIETPAYDLLYTSGKIEYRRYHPYIVAETEVQNARSRNDAANEGFKRLFGYISGDNKTKADISMTAPVHQAALGTKIAMTAPVQEVATAQGWLIAFMLPDSYTMDSAPVPTNTKVQLRQVPARLMAVIRYSGRWTTKNVDKYQAVLETHINSSGITVLGSPETAFYDPPFMPPFMRHNEVMMEVAAAPEEGATEAP